MACPSEREVLDRLAGRLSRDAEEALDRHVSECSACRQLMAALGRIGEQSEDPPPPPAATDGRYEVSRVLGRGGMGIVYQAWDRELQRSVALKLVRPGVLSEEYSRRLEQEARAMAKVRDPHVATVYDVGRLDGEVYIAMELIEGCTLDRWARAHAPSIRTLVAVCVQAGRGLVALHDAGLVHRDFKPSNVIVRETRSGPLATVIDLGLSAFDAPELEEACTGPSTVEDTSPAGTPAYMAPEQLDGHRADALSDQFAFCVSMFELLTGGRPFDEANLEALRASMRHPPDARVLAAHGVPSKVARAILRGLSETRGRRWPDLDGLLRVLERRRATRRARLAALTLAAAVGGGALTASWTSPPSCTTSSPTLSGVWSAPVRAEIEAAFPRERAAAFIERADAYAHDWSTAYAAACNDPAASTSRRSCLSRQLAAFEVGIDVVTAERDVPGGFFSELPLPADCDGAALSATAVPMDRTERLRVERLLLDGRADLQRGETRQAAAALDAALSASEGLDHRLHARAGLLRGDVYASTAPNEAQEQWSLALSEARRVHASGLAARAGIRVARTSHRTDGRRWAIQALDDARHVGSAELEAHALLACAELSGEWDDHDAAFAELRLVEELLPSLDRVTSERFAFEVGLVQAVLWSEAGRSGASLNALAALVEHSTSSWGPDDGTTIRARITLGNHLASIGDTSGAGAELRTALAAARRRRGAALREEALAARGLGQVALQRAELGKAKAYLAVAIRQFEALGDAYERGRTLVASARLVRDRGHVQAALQRMREGIALIRESSGANHPKLAHAELVLGRTLLAADHLVEAALLIERAASVLAASPNPEVIAWAHNAEGLLAASARRPKDAVTHHENALRALHHAENPSPALEQRTHQLLSEALRKAELGDNVSARANRTETE